LNSKVAGINTDISSIKEKMNKEDTSTTSDFSTDHTDIVAL
tara:strand:+ start:637 stop:759 length:123 start_codon:yes stop_codon:yes gene_type:complete